MLATAAFAVEHRLFSDICQVVLIYVPKLIYGSLCPRMSSSPKQHLISAAVFARLTYVTDRQTGRQTTLYQDV